MRLFRRRLRSGLSILESLALLAICTILLLVVVPVTLVRMHILKPVEQVGAKKPVSSDRDRKPQVAPMPPPLQPQLPNLPTDSPKDDPSEPREIPGKLPDTRLNRPVVPRTPTPPAQSLPSGSTPKE